MGALAGRRTVRCLRKGLLTMPNADRQHRWSRGAIYLYGCVLVRVDHRGVDISSYPTTQEADEAFGCLLAWTV